MKPIQEIAKIAHKLPLEAIQDINQRIGNWMVSGGSEDDPYIHQQLRYARRFVRRENHGRQQDAIKNRLAQRDVSGRAGNGNRNDFMGS